MTEREHQIDLELRKNDIAYLSGYDSWDAIINVQCQICGHEWSMNVHNLLQNLRGNRKKKNYVPCPNCRKAIEEKARMIARYLVGEKKFFNTFSRWLKRNTIRNRRELHRKCKNCGKEFTTEREDKFYCSLRCNNRSHEARKQKKRRNIVESNRHDNVTLDKLFKRDKGVCYLCGTMCDYNDFKKIDNYIVVGEKYPSVEHIKPVSLGGTDTWDNVKLAHKRCNSMKGTKYSQQISLFS